MFLYFHIAIFYLCALFLWTVNPAYFDLIGHLDNFDIEADFDCWGRPG